MEMSFSVMDTMSPTPKYKASKPPEYRRAVTTTHVSTNNQP